MQVVTMSTRSGIMNLPGIPGPGFERSSRVEAGGLVSSVHAIGRGALINSGVLALPELQHLLHVVYPVSKLQGGSDKHESC